MIRRPVTEVRSEAMRRVLKRQPAHECWYVLDNAPHPPTVVHGWRLFVPNPHRTQWTASGLTAFVRPSGTRSLVMVSADAVFTTHAEAEQEAALRALSG